MENLVNKLKDLQGDTTLDINLRSLIGATLDLVELHSNNPEKENKELLKAICKMVINKTPNREK